jgi:glycosyltransferase involved in cell wall biosynthesis
VNDAAAEGRKRVLFVTWDGPEYQYLESLFLPIFDKLRGHGFDFDVLQFTWGAQASGTTLTPAAAAARRLGIGYEAVAVLRRPIAAGSLLTAILGARHVRRTVRARRSEIVLARSTLPALATLLTRRSRDRWRFVFDLDGLPTDERVEFAGLDPRSPVARLQWAIERRAIRAADAVTTRSTAITPLIIKRGAPDTSAAKVFRVPNCRDENRFVVASPDAKKAARRVLGIPEEAKVIGYVGSSLGGKYRGDALLDFFRRIHGTLPSAHLMILTGDRQVAESLVSLTAPELARQIVIASAAANEVPFLLGAADLGTAFIEPTPSMRAAAAVKLGEYLLCGLPVVATKGIGDVHERLGPPSVFFIDDNQPAELERAALWFQSWVQESRPDHRQRLARQAGIAEYGLDAGAESYARALRFSDRNSDASRGACPATE